MKLNVSPKELLALHNLLLAATAPPHKKYEPGVDPVPDEVYLGQLFARVRSLIVASIGRQSDDPGEAKKATMEGALAREQAKIDKLKVDLIDVKKDQVDLATGRYVVPDGDDDLQVPVYPTRPRRAHGGHSGGRKK